MSEIKIGIVGAGAVGGVIGALLSEKGYDVEVAKRYNSDIVLDNYVNLEITGVFGSKNILVKAVNGVNGFTTKKDVIFVLTKAYDAPEVAKQCLPHLTDNGIIISSQNVMNVEEMINVVGSDRLFALIINWSAVRFNKATMEVTRPGNMIIGNFGDKSAKYLEAMKRILSNIAPTEISNNIIGDIWCRTIINSCIGSVGALTGLNLGKSMMFPTTKHIFVNIIFEAMSLAKALNVAVKNYGALNYYEFTKRGFKAFLYRRKMLRRLKKQNGHFVSSCQRAIENNQKSEIDYLNGYFVKLGQKHSVSVPTNKRMFDMVKEIEKGERHMMLENLMDYYLLHPKKYLRVLKINKEV